MKKKIVLLIGVIPVMVITLIGAIIGYGSIVNASESKSLADLEYEEELRLNWEMVELADKVERTIANEFNIVDRFKDSYPSYFGGIYISDDSTALIIQIVKKNIPTEGSIDYKFYSNLINLDERIKIKYVDYSFNELNLANNDVSDFMTSKESNISSKIMSAKELNNAKNNIIGTYIDVINNSVVVEVLEENDKQQQQFRTHISNKIYNLSESINNQLITFEKGELASTYGELNAGGNISDLGCSMGFRVKVNGQEGYVTAGHCVEGKHMINSGIVNNDYTQFADNEKYDYAFVEKKYSYNLTNKLQYPGKDVTKLAVVNYCTVLTTNMKIAKSGEKTKYTTGKITGLNKTKTFTRENKPDITIKGLVKSNVKADRGDSGGVVMIPKTDSAGGAVAIGVISGGGKEGFLNLETATYFTDMLSMPMDLQRRY